MKFVLVNPGFLKGGMGAVFRTPPLGLLYVAGAISRAGNHDIKILDLVVDPKTPQQLHAEFSRADVVGVSCLTSSFIRAKELCAIAKQAGATTIMGGFQPTLMPAIARFPEIDAIVRGEAEETMTDLTRKMANDEDWRNIPGVSYYDRQIGKYVHMPDRPLVADLDQLPLPRFDLVEHLNYRCFGVEAQCLETSRGCTFGCTFCCVAKIYGRSWRVKSLDRVIQEHRLLPKKTQWVFNVDDNYVMNPKRAITLSKRLIKEGFSNRSMIIQARADALARNPDMLDWLKRSGVKLVFIGVESVHPQALKRLNKGVKDVQYIHQALQGLHQRGIASWASLISGVEDDYALARDALDYTIDFLIQHGVHIMQCTSLTAYPGTPFYDEAVQKGWIPPIDLDHPELVNLCPDRPGLSREQMKKLVERAFRRFYLNPRYFFKPEKWTNLFFKRQWWWLYSILGNFAKVGIKDFIIGTILNKKLWEDQKLDGLKAENSHFEILGEKKGKQELAAEMLIPNVQSASPKVKAVVPKKNNPQQGTEGDTR